MDDKILVVKKFSFDAAHILPGYDGPCGFLHGHTYHLEVGVEGEVNRHSTRPEDAMVMDFKDLKNDVYSMITSRLDHSYLNEPVNCNIYTPGFPTHMPTAENMVLWIRDRLLLQIKAHRLVFIRLWETPTSYAEWRAR